MPKQKIILPKQKSEISDLQIVIKVILPKQNFLAHAHVYILSIYNNKYINNIFNNKERVYEIGVWGKNKRNAHLVKMSIAFQKSSVVFIDLLSDLTASVTAFPNPFRI